MEMLPTFDSCKQDVLPVLDLCVRRGFEFVYDKGEQLARYGVRRAPHRTAAAWYLWRAADYLNGGGG